LSPFLQHPITELTTKTNKQTTNNKTAIQRFLIHGSDTLAGIPRSKQTPTNPKHGTCFNMPFLICVSIPTGDMLLTFSGRVQWEIR